MQDVGNFPVCFLALLVGRHYPTRVKCYPRSQDITRKRSYYDVTSTQLFVNKMYIQRSIANTYNYNAVDVPLLILVPRDILDGVMKGGRPRGRPMMRSIDNLK